MTTNNHPAHGPVSLDRLHQIHGILSKASAQSDGGNLGYAMADAVKVIDGAIAAFGAEPVLYAAEETLVYAKMGELHLKCLSQPMGDAVIPLYRNAQSAPVSVPGELTREEYRRRFMMEDNFNDTYRGGWNACRAAMLQAGNSPVTPDTWIPVSELMPDKLIPVMVMYEDGEMWSAMWNGNRWDDGTEYPDPHSVTHWQKMPAAPQQEVQGE
ncbi:DUF551 domain-containing protein [Citrobacter portucalensis]|uniref:DUF551 domain-containing protein n=1 Tax=Citrobacter portucalensis TaxID=1639133 RepID=UPI002FE6585F